MATIPGTSSDTAETQDSRLASDSVVTDARDRMTGESPPSGIGGDSQSVEYKAGDLEYLILWKVNHIVARRCERCQAELGELLRDWRSQNEPHSPPVIEEEEK